MGRKPDQDSVEIPFSKGSKELGRLAEVNLVQLLLGPLNLVLPHREGVWKKLVSVVHLRTT